LKKVRARQSPAYVEPETRIVRDRGGVVTRTVFEIGKSHAITLPKEFVEAHGIKGGDAVIIYFDDDVAHIEPVKKEDIVKKVNK
jgi:virulence-associated protein VagC